MSTLYIPRRPARDEYRTLRGLRHHFNVWGDASLVTPERPLLFLAHGWMDVGASFQFVVDELSDAEGFERHIVACDWRGFGLTDSVPAGYWFPDYLADLEAMLDLFSPGAKVDLLGHSMGANISTVYAGVRPDRVRKLVNLEGFGLPDTRPADAPKRYGKWLDELKSPAQLRSYDSAAAVAARLTGNDPRLTPDKAAWLALHWAEERADGRWHIRADPAHKHVNPVLYRAAEQVACWANIEAPMLWVDGDLTDLSGWWGDRYPREEFEQRLSAVRRVERERLSPAGHNLHHDQPKALAERMARFLS